MQVAFEYTTSYMTQVIGISAVTVGTVATLRTTSAASWVRQWPGLGQTVSNPLQGLPLSVTDRDCSLYIAVFSPESRDLALR